MRPNFYLLLIVSLSFCLVPATEAFSAVKFNPSLTLEEIYTDNLFLESTGEEEDFITTIQPGFYLLFDNRNIDFSLDYSLRYQFYKNNDQEDLEDFEDVQRADMKLTFFKDRPFTLLVNEVIASEELDRRDRRSDLLETVNRSTVYRLTVYPEYRLRLSPTFTAAAGYIYNRVDYVDSAGNDAETHTAVFSVTKQLAANTEAYTKYTYSKNQSEDEEDYDLQKILLGLQHRLGSRLDATVEGGYSILEYDSGWDDDAYDWLLDLTYHLSEAIETTLSYQRQYQLSATEGVALDQVTRLGIKYAKRDLNAGVDLYYGTADYLRDPREDRYYGIRSNIVVPLTSVFSCGFDAEYERGDYDPDNEEVDRYQFGAKLSYEYRRFLASLGYRYLRNDSNHWDNDYAMNSVTLTASVRF